MADQAVGQTDRENCEIRQLSYLLEKDTQPRFLIPSLQRGYRWGREEVEKLLDDVHQNYKTRRRALAPLIEQGNDAVVDQQALSQAYCLQNVTVQRRADGSYSVIDGQQRLTTIYIIFRALSLMNMIYRGTSASYEKARRLKIAYEKYGGEDAPFQQKLEELLKQVADLDGDMDGKRALAEQLIGELLDSSDVGIDGKFMAAAFDSCCQTFWAFLGDDQSKGEDRLVDLSKRFKYCTTFIWYETEGNAHVDFANLNATKIPLTKSELIKALFMDPSNYIAAGQSFSADSIKARQIMLGTSWDDMEKQLHRDHLWYLIPKSGESSRSTRIDAIVDLYVYCRLLKNKPGQTTLQVISDPLWSYKLLEKEISGRLKQAASSDKKAEIMEDCWNEIHDLYEVYLNIYESHSCGGAMDFGMFHRLGLFQLVSGWAFRYIDKGSESERLVKQLEEHSALLEELSRTPHDRQKIAMNRFLLRQLQRIWGSAACTVAKEIDKDKLTLLDPAGALKQGDELKDALSGQLRALCYIESREKSLLVDVYQIIFSLEILEQNRGSQARFSFCDYLDGDWIKEHIFARGTDPSAPSQHNPLVKEVNGQLEWDLDRVRELLRQLRDCGWEDYLDFRWDGLVSGTALNRMKQVKRAYLKLMNPDRLDARAVQVGAGPFSASFDEKTGPTCDQIFHAHTKPHELDPRADEQELDRVNAQKEHCDGPFVEFLKDNSMGNMAQLTRRDNTAVSNHNFRQKSSMIHEKMQKNFVPAATERMFMGEYTANRETLYWLPVHRQKYLERMIESVQAYLTLGGDT